MSASALATRPHSYWVSPAKIVSAPRTHWSAAQIEKHKKAELAKAPPASIFWPYFQTMRTAQMNLAFTLEDALFLPGLVLGVLGLLCLGVGIIAGALWMFLSFGSEWTYPAMCVFFLAAGFCFALGILGLGLIGINDLVGDIRFREPAHWEEYPAENYRGIIPSQAKKLISEARDKNRSVKIHGLVQNNVRLDPILEIDGEFPLVWDENGIIVLPHG